MKIRFCNYHKVEHIVDKDYDPSQCFYDDATDPTDSQSIERTPDFTASKLSTTQTTKLENEIDEILDDIGLWEGRDMAFDPAKAAILTLIQSESNRIALEARVMAVKELIETFESTGKRPSIDRIWQFQEGQLKALDEIIQASLTAPEGGNPSK